MGAAGYDISVARYAYIPSLALDFFYGINANQFAFRTQHPAADPELAYRQNLGYSAQATLNIPVWNWGATRSKIKQAEFKARSGATGPDAGAANAAKQCRQRTGGSDPRAGPARIVAQLSRSCGRELALDGAPLSGRGGHGTPKW